MTTLKGWMYPDWVYTSSRKIRDISLSKFPAQITIVQDVIKPGDNKYYPDWAIKIELKIKTNDRITGKPLIVRDSNEGFYLYKENKNVEEILYAATQRLLEHELRECFQITETYPNQIPFDPHAKKYYYIRTSSYNKIELYSLYPSFWTMLAIEIKSWIKNIFDKLNNLIEKKLNK